jgi:hypothetical protein
MTGDTKAKGVGAQVETLIRDESMTELEKLAREATPGPWSSDRADYKGAPSEVAAHDGSDWELFIADCRTGEANAAYIAAASPDVVLRLLSELKRLRSQVEEMRGVLEQAAGQFRHYEQLHDAKGTEDGRQKAIINSMFAEVCEQALALSEEQNP